MMASLESFDLALAVVTKRSSKQFLQIKAMGQALCSARHTNLVSFLQRNQVFCIFVVEMKKLGHRAKYLRMADLGSKRLSE